MIPTVQGIPCKSDEIKRLENELEFAHDTMATVIVNLESIHHAYRSSETELEERKMATRLCEKEKELLTAYGEVKLQVNHLVRTIESLEKQITILKEDINVTPYLSSPCSSIDTTISYTTPVVNYTQPDLLLDTFYGLDPTCDLFAYDDYTVCNPLFYDYPYTMY